MVAGISWLLMNQAGSRVNTLSAEVMGELDQQLIHAARELIRQQPPLFRPAPAQRLAGIWPARPLVAAMLKKRVGKRASPEHYPAPYRLIDHWSRYAGRPVAMYASEANTVAELITGDTAQNLIRVVMLRNRLKGLASRKDLDPQHVHVVGGGVMGGDIAAWCALKGMRVTLQDRAPEYISRAIHRAHVLFRKKLRNPNLSTEYTDPDMARKAAAFALHLGKRPLPVNSSPGFLVNRVLLPCLLEAGIIFGTGFAPFRGGPLHYVHAQGSEILQKCLHGLEYRYGKHFHASNGWGAVG